MVKAEVRIIDPYRPDLNKTYICYPTETHIINDGTTTYEFHFNFQFPAIQRRPRKMTNEEAREHMDMLIAHKDKALETHPYFERCDSCIHSEEQDGSNCYECAKGMSDNFELYPTSDDDIIKALKTVRTIHNGNYAPQIDEAIRRLKARPTDVDCISREAVIQIIENKLKSCTNMFTCLEMCNIEADVEEMPPFTPQIEPSEDKK